MKILLQTTLTDDDSLTSVTSILTKGDLTVVLCHPKAPSIRERGTKYWQMKRWAVYPESGCCGYWLYLLLLVSKRKTINTLYYRKQCFRRGI